MPASAKSPNYFLASLATADLNRLLPRMRTITLPASTVLYRPGDALTRVYFPYCGMISILVSLRSGALVEVGTIGSNGMVGGGSALGAGCAINHAVVQVEMTAAVVDAHAVGHLASERSSVRKQLIRHVQMLFAQAQHIAACNAAHDIEERLCRWLSHARDLLETDTMHLTQELIAQMLGVQRSSLTLAAQRLQDLGLIQYRRGRIHVIDPIALTQSACECYGAVNEQFERLIGWRPRGTPSRGAAPVPVDISSRGEPSWPQQSNLRRNSLKGG